MIKNGDIEEISLIETLMKSAYELIYNAKNSISNNNDNNNRQNRYFDIHQNNYGRDATVNLGTILK